MWFFIFTAQKSAAETASAVLIPEAARVAVILTVQRKKTRKNNLLRKGALVSEALFHFQGKNREIEQK